MDQNCQRDGVAARAEAPRPSAGATRVRFRERQTLRVADLADEQAYHVAMRRRHNVSHHTWGVVSGLRLTSAGDAVVVGSGMAVDGYGRELFVAEPTAIRGEAFEQLGTDVLDVWLVYDRVEEATPQKGRWACGEGQHNRWRELSRLRLTPAREQEDPRAPGEVPFEDLAPAPHRAPPDDPARQWPVFLGTARLPGTQAPPDALPRPYAGLVGESINAPSGGARLRVGGELAADASRFAVALPDASGAFVERLALDRSGAATVRGDATVGGDVWLREHEGEAGSDPPRFIDHCNPSPTSADEERAANAIIFTPPAATPAAAAPWQLYRTTITQDGKSVRQLRFEVGHPGDKGDPRLYRFAIGSSDPGGVFDACLSVAADCTVTVAGDLEVLGSLIEGPIKPDASDPRFSAALLSNWTKGAAAANSQLGSVFNPVAELEVTAASDDFVFVRQALSYRVEITNHGLSTITNVEVYGNLTHEDGSGTVLRTERIRGGPFTVAPGRTEGTQQFTSAPTTSAGRLVIAVTAIGIGPLSNVLSDSDTTEVSVDEQIG